MSKQPNILWVSFEDTYPFYGCYGDKVARTPNLDRLAAEGCRWDNAFSTAAVCAPARCAVITGMYAASIGAQHMRTAHVQPQTPDLPTPYETVTPPHIKCFSEYLRAAGYYCTNTQKTDYQFDPPVTAWDQQGSHGHWRNRPDPDQPFFAVFNLEESHESGMWEEDRHPCTFDPDTIEVPPFLPDTPKVRQSLARMYTHIENNDRRLGELLQQLEEDGLADNTIVFNWSDHGPLPRGKRWPYDSGIKIPMIVRWPGELEPGSVSDELVSSIDLGPTVLSLCGLEIPPHLQGQAFLGSDAQKREYVFATRDRLDCAYDKVRAARDKRFKYLRHFYPSQPYLNWGPYRNHHPIMQEIWRLHLAGELTEEQSQLFRYPRYQEELYDTLADPHELHNLSDNPEFENELIRLREACEQWMEDIQDMGDIPESEMVQRWWPGGKQPKTIDPLFIPIEEGNYGEEAIKGEYVFKDPAVLQLHSPTQGASIAYTYEGGEDPHWLLYTEPLKPTDGDILRAKAIRIGYKESAEVSLKLTAAPKAAVSR